MPMQPIRRCDDCGYETTAKTDICLSCGERLRRRVKGGVRGLIRTVVLLLIAVYILFSAFKDFDFRF